MITTTQRNHTGWRDLRWISVLFLLLLFCAVAPASAAENALKKASLMPLWSPQAQFAGYYVALDKGIFARHGIDLEILKATWPFSCTGTEEWYSRLRCALANNRTSVSLYRYKTCQLGPNHPAFIYDADL